MSSRFNRLAFAALIAGATGIGFAPILVRFSDTGPSATAFYRLFFALPLLWLWAARDRRRNPSFRPPDSTREFLLLGTAGLFFTADLSIWHWSLQFTTVANSTLLTNVTPILVTIAAWRLFGEQITRTFVVGLLLAVAGGVLLVLHSAEFGGRNLLGDMLALLAAVFYAGYLITVKQLRRTFSAPTIMAWSGLVSCPAFALIALAAGEQMAPPSARGWLAVVALALVSHMGGQSLIAYAFGHLPASFSSVSLLWQPVVAAVLAWPLLGEPLRGLQIVGGIVTLAGIALASGTLDGLRRNRAKRFSSRIFR